MYISFCGLNENVSLGYKAIRDVNQDYPRGFISNSYYDTFTTSYNRKISNKLCDKIFQTRDIVEEQMEDFGKRRYEAVEKAVKSTNCANCEEQSVLVSKRLNDSGIKNEVVSVAVYKRSSQSTEYVDGHCFCLLGMADGYDIKNPKTWGKDAVIVDMWLGNVEKADKAYKKILKLINFNQNNKKNEFLILSKIDCNL